jgi:hypothetical protein
VVPRVLVVVDEHGPGVAVAAPPGRRHLVGEPSLDLAREGEGGSTYLGESVVGGDPHVDVQAAPAAGLRVPVGAELGQDLLGDGGGPPDRGVRRLRHGIEVDPPLVGRLGVSAARVPGVELDGAHLDRPDDVGEPRHTQLVGMQAPPGEVEPDGLDPGWGPSGEALLVDLLAVDAVREAMQHAGSLPQRVDDAGADGEVVAGEVELGLPAGGEVGPVRIADPHVEPVDVEDHRLPELPLARRHEP